MKKIFMAGAFFLAVNISFATEKIWIPLGTPQMTPPAVSTSTHNTSEAVPEGTATPVMPGPEDGHWVYSYMDGTTESQGDYAGGKKDGIWKYYRPDGMECREVEFAQGEMTGKLVLLGPQGGQKYFEHFTDLIAKDVPFGARVKAVLPYLADLAGDGKEKIVAIARLEQGSVLLVLNSKGVLLDSKPIGGVGTGDDFVFGQVKAGMPLCFGYDSGCALSGGICDWEIDVFDGQKIRTVLQYNGWYGKSGPFTLPVFKDVDGDGMNEIVTDNGTFKWDADGGNFKRMK